jgi:hypothetical protein
LQLTGISLSFPSQHTIAEAVNYSLNDWLAEGIESVRRYRRARRVCYLFRETHPCFSSRVKEPSLPTSQETVIDMENVLIAGR